MRLILVRHAEAEPAAEATPGGDAARPLTAAGRRQAAHLAAALRRLKIVPDLVITSPLARTTETAELIAPDTSAGLPVVSSEQLWPDELRPKKLSETIAALDADTVVVVGHMPDIGRYTAWLIGAAEHAIPFDRCGAACVTFSGRLPSEARGTLEWFVDPSWCERLSEMRYS